MKLLFITHTPVGDRSYGGAIRANSLRDGLVAAGDVDTLIVNGGPFSIDPDWRPGRIRFVAYGSGRAGIAGRWRVRQWIGRLAEAEGYDAVIVQYIDLALLLPRALHERSIFDADDFRKTITPGMSRPKRLKYAIRNAAAEWVASRMRHSWLVNPTPAQRPKAGRNSLVPNIVPLPAPDRIRAAAVPGRILMVGLMKHAPNIAGLEWFYDLVWPSLKQRFPAASLHVIGRHADDLPTRFPDAVFRGFVERLEPEYDAAQLVVAPIFTGAGTQIKVLDALGHARPLVASNFAVAGFAPFLKEEEHLLTADDAASWISQCSRVLQTPAASEQMAVRGAQAVHRNYGQQIVNDEVARTLATIVATPAASGR